MTTDKHKITREGVTLLRGAIERYIDRRIKTPADFDYLSSLIISTLKLPVSATTLKRVWGYINDKGDSYLPGRYTLCVLARFLDFKDYEDFIDHSQEKEIQSHTYWGNTIECNTLSPGCIVRVTWAPDRICRLKHITDCHFEVIESHNAKIHVNDKVVCTTLTQHAPIHLNIINRGEQSPLLYVAGARTGIIYAIED